MASSPACPSPVLSACSPASSTRSTVHALLSAPPCMLSCPHAPPCRLSRSLHRACSLARHPRMLLVSLARRHPRAWMLRHAPPPPALCLTRSLIYAPPCLDAPPMPACSSSHSCAHSCAPDAPPVPLTWSHAQYTAHRHTVSLSHTVYSHTRSIPHRHTVSLSHSILTHVQYTAHTHSISLTHSILTHAQYIARGGLFIAAFASPSACTIVACASRMHACALARTHAHSRTSTHIPTHTHTARLCGNCRRGGCCGMSSTAPSASPTPSATSPLPLARGSLTHSLTHSLTLTLTHSLTHSVPHSPSLSFYPHSLSFSLCTSNFISVSQKTKVALSVFCLSHCLAFIH